MATYAALVSLLNNIEQMMNHPLISTFLDNEQIQPLVEKAGFLLEFIEGYNNGGGSKEAEDLERQIASAAHAAEDVIEFHIVDQIHDRSSLRISHLLTFLLRCVGCDRSKKWVDLQPIIEEMDAIMKKATEVKERRGVRDEQATHSKAVMEFSGETAMVGFDGELTQLLDELTSHQSNRHTISIIGMGGMGKTTLAKTVYKNLLIMQHFDIRVWATVSQQFNVKEILSQLVYGQGKSSNEITIGVLGEKLHKILSGRRYLIILDDVWSVDVWDKVRFFLPDNGNGSRVVLTTRFSNVAIDCGSTCLTKNLLNENESWELFCKKAFEHEHCPRELEEVGKEIVKLCKGLPLPVVVIGGRLLKSPRSVVYWKDVANDIKYRSNSKEKEESLDVLFSSYIHLPPHLKPCFLYIGVFKTQSPSILRVSKLIKLWVAEGFLKSNGSKVLEEIAEDYLKDLIDRNLISVGRRGDDGKMKTYDIHDLLRELCLKVANQQEFGRATESRSPLARSIMKISVAEQTFGKHRLVRILDVYSYRSAQEILECVNLRYLAVGWRLESWSSKQVCEFPTSVSLIWNLQTLTLNEMIVAWAEIWKMGRLRHVNCRGMYIPDTLRNGQDVKLENLQTLKTAVNLRLSEKVCNIIPNIKKLHLWYDDKSQGYDDSLIECLCNLDRLHKLESLNLLFYIERWLTELNNIVTYPSSLSKLTLTCHQLDWKDMTIIGSLPQLQVLKLNSCSTFKSQEWSPSHGQFLRLKFLKIARCDLVRWNAESCHFPILEKLILGGLPKLEEFPSGIGEIPTLKLIRLEICSESAAITVVKMKEDQLENEGNDDLQIQLKMFDSELQSLREKLETEGLTLDNIQLETF